MGGKAEELSSLNTKKSMQISNHKTTKKNWNPNTYFDHTQYYVHSHQLQFKVNSLLLYRFK